MYKLTLLHYDKGPRTAGLRKERLCGVMVLELSVHCHLVLVPLGPGGREHCGGSMWQKKAMCLMGQEVKVDTGKELGSQYPLQGYVPSDLTSSP